ncbi:NAD+ synthetase [Actinobacteria bacterium IMCC26207]|nr:NAD+ synthetase [Actinobacteria bacterium IMCC26207]
MTGPSTLRVAMCQLNLRVGDLAGNMAALSQAYDQAEAAGADIALFPELAACGYPPEDLLLKPGFVDDLQDAVAEFARCITGHCTAIVGWVEVHNGELFNSAAVIRDSRMLGSYRKQALPNYGVFDEKRYFSAGTADQALYEIAGVTVSVTVCEDVWVDDGPILAAARRGAALAVNINASPFHIGKQQVREEMLSRRAAEAGIPIAYLNLVGGQDELVFDGGSVVVAATGLVTSRLPRFESACTVVDVDLLASGEEGANQTGPALEDIETSLAEVWKALVLGLHDYVTKNGFSEVVIGLSGGVDSSIVAALATDALGAESVHGVLMPSRYSSDHSLSDAETLAKNLGIDHRTIPIEAAHLALLDLLEPSFEGRDADLTEENLQSRIRGVLLMALSNKFGWMVLTTGNKSETAVGYSTLYGDTAGGLAVIKDVPKLMVYDLCAWRNEQQDLDLIPASVLTKAPSAELRPDQRDDQSLPPYEVLDPIIQGYVDEDLTTEELVEVGHDAELVSKIVGLIDRAEYKRRQSPPGIRISEKAFGRDRRIPITNAYAVSSRSSNSAARAMDSETP